MAPHILSRMKLFSGAWRYGLAILSCGVALATALWMDAPSSCLVLAVMVSSLFGGKGPGVLSVGLSALGFDYFFLPPRFHLIAEPSSYPRFAVFLAAIVLTAVLVEAKRRVEQSQVQKELGDIQKSETRFRLIIDTVPALAWSASPDGSVDFFNQRYLDYTGLSLEQGLGWGWKDLVHPDDVESLLNSWRFNLASGEAGEIEARLRRFDGEYRWFLLRASPLRDEAGNVVKWYGTNTDIGDRKRAEEALRKSELDFRLMVDSIPGLVSTMTPAGDAELVNEQVMDYTGKTLEEMKNWLPTIHPDDRALVADRWQGSVESGNPYDVEERIQRADGVYRWFHARGLPLRDAEGNIVRWYVLLTDIEDQKRAEEALRARERDLALIIETIPALVWCASATGQLTYVNQRVLDYIGTTLDRLVLNGWTHFLHPDDFEPTVRAWSHAVTTGQQHEVQYRLRRHDGAYRWFHVLGQPFRDGRGQVIRWYGLLLDIDDRKRMEEALRTTQTQLARATQIATVGELAASIAHEINQPLAAVVANGHACLRWLSAEPPSLTKAYEAAERIVRDGKDAGEVVQRIRALFKRAAPEKVALDMNEVIGEVLRLLSSETTKRRVVVEADLEAALPPVIGDRVQLQQLVLNLLINGLDAMDAVVDRPRKLCIRSTRDDPRTVLVEMRDYGVGLKDPDKVFDAFFTTKEKGMGMGLTICRSIAEAHDGHLWASSVEGPGARFCFTLPMMSTVAE